MLISCFLAMFMSFQGPRFDAMVSWKANKAYAFSGAYYYRYDLGTNAMDPGYPKPIAGNWAGLPFQTIDAAINWQNGKAYFFSGAYFVRYDIATDRADPGYPKPINPSWNLPWNKVDAALYWSQGYAYFFNNGAQAYVRYKTSGNYPDPGYPKYTSSAWPFTYVDGATSYFNRGYFAYGGTFNRMAIPGTKIDMGYPKALNYLPDVARGGYPPPAVRPPPTPPTTYRPPNNPATNTAKCTVNGTLTYLGRNANGSSVYQQWNNVTVELHQANAYFAGRYNQYLAQGHDASSAMSGCVREDQLWTKVTSSITKPCQYASPKYGMAYSWFGFVQLNPGTYRVHVPGYPTLNRWIKFPAGGQKLTVALEHQ